MDEVNMERMEKELAQDAARARAKRQLELLIIVRSEIVMEPTPFDDMTEAEITESIVHATIETLLPVCARQKILLVRVLV